MPTLFVLVILLASGLSALSACAECGDDDGQCDGAIAQQCRDGVFVDITDCAAQGLVCVEACVDGIPCCR